MPLVPPTPQQVHAYLPQRPLFTDTSRPSIAEVNAIIDVVADAVLAETSTGVFPDRLAGKVLQVIALNVAAQIENSYFPEQGIGTDSGADYLYRQYQAELLGLRALLAKPDVPIGTNGAGSAFTVDTVPAMPYSGFVWDVQPDGLYPAGWYPSAGWFPDAS